MSTGKKKCRGCTGKFPVDTMIKVQLSLFCTYTCAIDHAKKTVKKNALKKMKDGLLTKSDQEKITQRDCNKYCNERDHGKPCISCGCKMSRHARSHGTTNAQDAGHYRSVGAAPHIRFVVSNINGQCVRCNSPKYLSGNTVEYRRGYIERYGVKRMERIEADQRPRKYNIEQLQRMAALFRRRSRHFIKVREKYGEEKAKRTRCKV